MQNPSQEESPIEPVSEELPPTPRNLSELLGGAAIIPRLFVALVLFLTFLAIWYFIR